MTFQLDLMVQFLFKQGQVELEGTNLIPDYRDAILISRTIIEELNSVIRVTGLVSKLSLYRFALKF